MKTIWKTTHLLAVGLALAAPSARGATRERPPQGARVVVDAGRAACRVDLDADVAGATDVTGKLTLPDVESGDHYIHVSCPGKTEVAYYISPQAHATTTVGPLPDTPGSAPDPEAQAAQQARLRRLVQQAAQLRARGRIDDAVAALREAMKLDPENSDLHRELGITFLMAKEWKRARVEMLEAIRHDENDADAHNGLGYALEKLGDLEGAVMQYRMATELEPDDESYRTHYLETQARIAARKAAEK